MKQREKELVEWAADLQNKLEQSETTCYKLMEENGELKQEIENLATEVVEVRFECEIVLFGPTKKICQFQSSFSSTNIHSYI